MCLIILRRPATNLQSGMVYKTISGKVGNESVSALPHKIPSQNEGHVCCSLEGLENPHMEGFLKVIGVSKMDD